MQYTKVVLLLYTRVLWSKHVLNVFVRHSHTSPASAAVIIQILETDILYYLVSSNFHGLELIS